MTSDDYLKRRLRHAMRDGADIAEDLAIEEGVQLPPEYVGRMGLSLFRARMQVAFRDPDTLPEDDRRGSW